MILWASVRRSVTRPQLHQKQGFVENTAFLEDFVEYYSDISCLCSINMFFTTVIL